MTHCGFICDLSVGLIIEYVKRLCGGSFIYDQSFIYFESVQGRLRNIQLETLDIKARCRQFVSRIRNGKLSHNHAVADCCANELQVELLPSVVT